MSFAIRWLKWLTAKIPLCGRLGEVGPEGLKEAAAETLTTLIFATMPFWMLPGIGYFAFTPAPKFNAGMKNGEGLVFAAVLLGPLFYVITKRYGRFNLRFLSSNSPPRPLSISFPYGGAFSTVTALTCALAGFIFAFTSGRPLGASGLNQAGLATLSWILMIGAALIFFLSTPPLKDARMF